MPITMIAAEYIYSLCRAAVRLSSLYFFSEYVSGLNTVYKREKSLLIETDQTVSPGLNKLSDTANQVLTELRAYP